MPGRCALVTGSTAGLGFAIADRLAAEGCRIVLTGLAGPGELERAREELARKRGADVRCYGADLRDPAAI
ncbi:MAG: SDR family NAD(P)-dependent oxidoreductase, partial [Alphaproteobacteria bacterium]|nr:SDR family NAD(P)-dependent oxidoreductase [Alphaproteobacteria bacterium]